VRFEVRHLRRLLRVGWARTCVQLLESLRPLVLLRVISERGLGDAETGVLYAGLLFTLPLIAVPERLAQALYPTMLDETGETADLDGRSRRVLRDLALVAIPLLVIVGGVLTLALPMFKGGAYAAAVPVVWILLPGVAAHGLAAHQGYVILVRHRLPREAVVSALALGTTGILAWLLVPALGPAGGAVALSTALVVRAAGITLVARGGTS
jgi:O-antigen/teichoic acid export membrane protein